MDQQTGSEFGRECIKAIYRHLAYLTSVQSTSCGTPGWMKHNLESRLLGEVPTSAMCHEVMGPDAMILVS